MAQGPKTRISFPYFRHQEFETHVQNLALGKAITYHPYDWKNQRLNKTACTLMPDKPVIIEGVSVLHDPVYKHLTASIFVASDIQSEWGAITVRETPEDLNAWKNYYLPSAEIYFAGKPWKKADILFGGRGIQDKAALEQWRAKQA